MGGNAGSRVMPFVALIGAMLQYRVSEGILTPALDPGAPTDLRSGSATRPDLLFRHLRANLPLADDLNAWHFQAATLRDRTNLDDEVFCDSLVARQDSPELDRTGLLSARRPTWSRNAHLKVDHFGLRGLDFLTPSIVTPTREGPNTSKRFEI
jgi:hypothetical protein